MDKKQTHLLDISAIIGMVILVLALCFSIFVSENQHIIINTLLPLLLVALGILICIFTFTYSHKAYHFFTSMLLLSWGISDFLMVRKFIPFNFYQLWPMLGVYVGIIIFASGFYKYRKLKFGYALPGLTVFFLGCFFLLFSLKIIKVPFSVVVMVGGPLLMIFTCLFLFSFFAMQQKYKNLIIKDDEHDSFDDDELIGKI
ncbi:MAG: hypothetical protein MJ188_02330 [Treponema sp.]|nr:hypothetical protein [Treponema sp.]